jgi:glycosyltransferase involved in cell wall biosynthesis
MEPVWYVDPVKTILGRRTHQSWLHFNPKAINDALLGADIVEIYEPYFFDSKQVAGLANKKGIIVITEIWTSFPNHPANFIPPYSLNVRSVIKNTDLFLVRSKRALSYLVQFNVPSKKIAVIYHGVNLKRFFPKRKKESSNKVIILFVGALRKSKGIGDLLTVSARLKKEFKGGTELVICGKGPLESEVKQHAQDKLVKYLGYVQHEAIPSIYQRSDIFCGPSKDIYSFGLKRWEEFVGYTFMEAMACALPIVTTDCGGVPEVVGKDNMMITQGNIEQLYKALRELISNKEKRLQIGAKNRKRAEKLFNLRNQVLKTEKEIIKRFF